MEVYRRTIYGATLQTAQYFGIPALIQPFSTLNEKLGIQASATLGPNEMPSVGLITIGIGGHHSVPGQDDIPLITNKVHRSDDAAPFKLFPFVLRPTNNDISGSQRDRFALRTIINVDGNDYFAYYGKRFSKQSLTIVPERRHVVNNETTTSPFEPTSDNLNPVPQDLDPGGVNTVEGEYVGVSVKLKITLDAFEAEEILNAATILYNNEDYAFISEIGLASFVNRTVSVPDGNGNTFNFNEAIATQITNHISALQPVKSQRGGFDIDLEVGAIEPLFRITS
jgi:hypothetical protein